MNGMATREAAVVCGECGVDDRDLSGNLHALPMRTMLHGKYVIGRLLGAGGFGNTYLAYDSVLRVKLAIKEYLPRDVATRSHEHTNVFVLSAAMQSQFQNGMDKFL